MVSSVEGIGEEMHNDYIKRIRVCFYKFLCKCVYVCVYVCVVCVCLHVCVYVGCLYMVCVVAYGTSDMWSCHLLI